MYGHRSPKPLHSGMKAMAAAWPPLMVIHGDKDAVVSAHNGPAAAQVWAAASGACAARERGVQRGKRYPMRVTDFKRGGVTMATLVKVGHLGHAWSGGAKDQHYSDGDGPDASRMAWGFAPKQFDATHASAP
jgi:hypothetical protein